MSVRERGLRSAGRSVITPRDGSESYRSARSGYRGGSRHDAAPYGDDGRESYRESSHRGRGGYEEEYHRPPRSSRGADVDRHSVRSGMYEDDRASHYSERRRGFEEPPRSVRGDGDAGYGPSRADDPPPSSSREFSFIPDTFVPFRNVEPVSRKVRRAKNDKEALEKTRLAHRSGGYHRGSDYKVGVSITKMDTKAPGYCPESDRFDTDTAAREKLSRDAKVEHTRNAYDHRRLRNAEREEERWRTMDEQARREKERIDYLRENTDKGKPNLSSVPFDPITLKYNDSRDGMILKHEDDKTRYRAALRAHHLQSRSMTTGGFNPITGDKVFQLNLPMKPEPLPGAARHTGKFHADGHFSRTTEGNKGW